MLYNREELLRLLESVQGGLTTKEDSVEQSTCFVFKEGKLVTYNNEVAFFNSCPLNLTGAVPAQQFLEILKIMTEDEVDIIEEENKLLIRSLPKKKVIDGKKKTIWKRKLELSREHEIALPIDDIEQPGEWSKLHEDFGDAIQSIQECAAKVNKEQNNHALTCVRVCSNWVEACDGYRGARYTISTGLKGSFLVKRDAIKQLVSLGMSKVSETESWVHFKNAAGLRMSCRRYIDSDFKDITPMLTSKGDKIKLPKALASEVRKAEILAKDNEENGALRIDLKLNTLILEGKGARGRYTAKMKINYSGKPSAFTIYPAVLKEIVKRAHECQVTNNLIKVNGGNFAYCSVIGEV